MPRRESPEEVELAQDALGPTNANTHHGRRRLEHGERYTFRFCNSEREAVVLGDLWCGSHRFSKPSPNVACQEWIRELQRVERQLSRAKESGTAGGGRCPRIVGFACRRYTEEVRYFMTPRDREIARLDVHPPLSIVAVCFGGTHCAAMTLPRGAQGGYGCGGNPIPAAMKEFLSDPRLSFVGYNIIRDAASLMDHWGIPLANPTELWPLVRKAFPEEWLRGDFGKNGKVKLEAMAGGVLHGVAVEEEPQKYRNESIAYAIRDACLAYDIAVKCEGPKKGKLAN